MAIYKMLHKEKYTQSPAVDSIWNANADVAWKESEITQFNENVELMNK